MDCFDLSGLWTCELDGIRAPMRLPGTLDENGIGYPDDPEKQWMADSVKKIGYWKQGDPIVTRLTRRHVFEGCAVISRTLDWTVPENSRLFADVERARGLNLLVNKKAAPLSRPASLSTPYCFEITGLVSGHDKFCFLSDNSYPGWPRGEIVYSSAASDETQTNWNGLLGRLCIRAERPVFISDVRVYPQGTSVRVFVETDAAYAWQGTLHIACDALQEDAYRPVSVLPGRQHFCFELALRTSAPRWDTEEGVLHRLTVSALGLDARTVRFGIRDFRAEGGFLWLNGRRIFLRGEANCAVFPETGYCPMETEQWKKILLAYRAYGVNCMRFHSHCPPEAAFCAADELGMLMQPELSHWDPQHAFGSNESREYYQDELSGILRCLANHPSFVMLTLGNELKTDEAGHAFMDALLQKARQYDPTRLYSNGSNTHYGELGADSQSDFYTAMQYRDTKMRAACDGMTGWLNNEYPNTCHDYSKAVSALRGVCEQPVFSFEVGQYEILPELSEPEDYHGVTAARNFEHIRNRVRQMGWEQEWRRRAEATGESSLLCYRAEAEAALRTAGYSGISLLGLQDFPGQGTALVGMMNAHLEPKPFDFARASRFSAFFADVLPLALLERFTYTEGETLKAGLKIANYGKRDLAGQTEWSLAGTDIAIQGVLPETAAAAGGLYEAGRIVLPLPKANGPYKAVLTLRFCDFENEYPLWVYPDERPVCPEEIYECRAFDERARAVLRGGGSVLLAPDSTAESIPRSVQAQFSPDFWSVCTFPHQTGTMGQLIDEKHPLFARFPTQSFNTWQWWPMARQRAMLLPGRAETIIAEMDSCAFLRPMAKLFECRCGGGRLMVSSLGLHRLQQYPEARALLSALYAYIRSDSFAPAQYLDEKWILSIFDGPSGTEEALPGQA